MFSVFSTVVKDMVAICEICNLQSRLANPNCTRPGFAGRYAARLGQIVRSYQVAGLANPPGW